MVPLLCMLNGGGMTLIRRSISIMMENAQTDYILIDAQVPSSCAGV